VGNLIRLDDDVLVLGSDDGSRTEEVPRRAITQVEISRHRSRKATGVGLGLLAGVVAAVVIGATTGEDCSRPAREGYFVDICFDKGTTGILAAFLTVPAGVAVGAIAAPGEKWDVVPASPIRLVVAPTPGGGVRGAVTVTWRGRR
jgi:hypothetical protein